MEIRSTKDEKNVSGSLFLCTWFSGTVRCELAVLVYVLRDAQDGT